MELRELLEQSLGDSITIERELGGGGMSRVFLATDRALGREVVIKVLPPELRESVSVERFKREITLAAGLQHPHIVPLLSAGEAEGTLYFTMPFVRGESLRARLKATGAVPLREAVRLLREVAAALHHAHEHNVVHRDIKPGNILISGESAMVTDFGVAKALTASGAVTETRSPEVLTSTGVAIGTPMYMAPEQATGERTIDHRADIYAFGVLAYEVLSGRPPFDEGSVSRLIVAHLSETPQPLTSRQSGVPTALGALVMRCLAKRPEDRPQSAADILQSLDDPAISGFVSSDSMVRRYPVRTLGFVVAGAAIVAAVALWPRGGGSTSAESAAGGATSIAVMPFENGGDTSLAYFSDGVTQELGLALAQIPGLHVAARSSMRALRGKTPAEAASLLNVSTIVEGTVRRFGPRIRIVASLIKASDGFVIWTKGYDDDTTDAFAVQDSVARAIAGALRTKLSPEADARLAKRGTHSVKAHDLVLRGRALVDRYTESSLRAAIQLFEEAISIDSNYADAWAGVRAALGRLTDSWVSPHETMPRMREALERTLRLDPDLAEAHASAGAYYFNWGRDFSRAEKEFITALTIDSTNLTAGILYSHLLASGRRADSATAVAFRAIRLNPLSATTLREAVRTLIWSGQVDSASAICPRLGELAPNGAEACQVRVLAAMGRHDEALLIARKLFPPNPVGTDHINFAIALARAGETTEARRAVDRAAAFARDHYVAGDRLAEAYATLGLTDDAFRALERALNEHSAGLAYLPVISPLQPLAKDPRFDSILRRAGHVLRP